MSTYLVKTVQLLVLAGIILITSSNAPPEKIKFEPVAVFELFTSQGCSSCPSADHLLTETLTEAAKTNQHIIGLSFHVDYWDRMGWKDPFSDHEFTKRQYTYGARFGLHGVYTPQEVLNGRQEFVGSNRAKQSSLLKTALSQAATAGVRLTVLTPSATTRSITYKLEGDLTDAVLNVALVSKTTETAVQRGENAGHKLIHNNVVRVFKVVTASPNGSVTLTLPDTFDPKNGAVVAYVQGPKTLEIRGATQLDL